MSSSWFAGCVSDRSLCFFVHQVLCVCMCVFMLSMYAHACAARLTLARRVCAACSIGTAGVIALAAGIAASRSLVRVNLGGVWRRAARGAAAAPPRHCARTARHRRRERGARRGRRGHCARSLRPRHNSARAVPRGGCDQGRGREGARGRGGCKHDTDDAVLGLCVAPPGASSIENRHTHAHTHTHMRAQRTPSGRPEHARWRVRWPATRRSGDSTWNVGRAVPPPPAPPCTPFSSPGAESRRQRHSR